MGALDDPSGHKQDCRTMQHEGRNKFKTQQKRCKIDLAFHELCAIEHNLCTYQFFAACSSVVEMDKNI